MTKLKYFLAAFTSIAVVFLMVLWAQRENAMPGVFSRTRTASNASVPAVTVKPDCISEGSSAATAAARRIRFNLILNEELQAEGWDIKARIVDCTWDELYLIGDDATGENIRRLMLRDDLRTGMKDLGFRELSFGGSMWSLKRIPLR